MKILQLIPMIKFLKEKAAAICYVLLFLLVVAALKNIDVAGKHFEASGAITLFYIYGRLIFAAYIFILCFTLGSFFLKRIFLNQKSIYDDLLKFPSSYLIASFFIGASFYGCLGSVLGLLGLLKWPIALLVTTPVLLMESSGLKAIALALQRKIYETFNKHSKNEKKLHIFLMLVLTITSIFLIFSNGLFPAVIDNDVYEHYYHYYRKVLESGNVWPNEVWYHFYLSKGAGLIFISNLLSDFTSSQLVSLLYVLMISLILFQLLLFVLESFTWSLLGLILFHGGILYSENSSGMFFKLHMISFGNLILIFYSVFQFVHNKDPLQKKMWFVTALITGFYFGYALPIPALIAIGFLSITILFSLIHLEWRTSKEYIFSVLASLCSGLLLVLFLNYCMTGFIEVFHDRFMWNLAWSNKEKFIDAFGTSGILFPLILNNDQPPQRQFLLNWLANCFRLDYFNSVTFFLKYLPPHLPFMLFLAVLCYSSKLRLRLKIFHILLAFLIPVIAFILPFEIASIYRLYVFTLFFMTLIYIFFIKQIYELIVSRFFYIDPYFFNIRKWRHYFIIAASFLIMHTVAAEFPVKRAVSLVRYATGKLSYAKTLLAHLNGNSLKDFELWLKIKKQLGYQTRIVRICPLPLPAFSFPGSGAISEPTYILGIKTSHLEIMYGSPEKAKALLQNLNLNYFLINPGDGFYSALVYSHLFDEKAIQKYFTIIFQENNYYVLTWKQDAHQPSNITEEFLEKFRNQRKLFDGAFGKMYRDKQKVLELVNYYNLEF